MQFKQDAQVVDAGGEKIGEVDRVVMDPKTGEMTHLVVKKGFIFTEDKVIPVDRIEKATEDEVTLKPGVEAMADLPDFRETEYVPMDEVDAAGSGYVPSYTLYYGAPGLAWWGYPGYAMPPYVARTQTNIPEGTIALSEGSKVYSRDGDSLGEVEQVFVDSKDHRASHIMVVKGILSKERRLIPTAWIDTVTEDEVHLAVNTAFLERLPSQKAA